jgi:hypothetical protein
MKRLQCCSLILALGLCTAPALQAQAQPTEGIRFGTGGGLIVPIGNYADVDKTGWNVLGVIQLPLSHSPLHLRFDALYGSTAHKVGSGKTNLFGATGGVLYHLGDRSASVRPYINGGLGLFNADGGGGSQTKLAFAGGAGILFGIGTLHAFLEGRYVSVQTSGSSISFIPITLGVMFGQ